uniref:Uncharacterized protein n=1 Tax=Arundo donax TaxID=35708 RepID=A0A0A9A5C3_ARUDO
MFTHTDYRMFIHETALCEEEMNRAKH